jgi:DNA-binding GntR family transcriptional regulator
MSMPGITRTAEVYEALRAELLNGLLTPGQRLKLIELAERFDVSQSVVRESLTRLAEQGLVTTTPQRGFRVRELSIPDISSLTEARVLIESMSLRLAVERGDVRWETQVVATHHMLERTPVARGDGSFNEAWPLAHQEFHRALLAGCGNPRLEAVANSLRDSAELYRRWYWVLADDHQRDLAGEHRQLRDLALARSAEPAIATLTEHIDRAPRQLIAYAREHGVEGLHRPGAPAAADKAVRGSI